MNKKGQQPPKRYPPHYATLFYDSETSDDDSLYGDLGFRGQDNKPSGGEKVFKVYIDDL